MYLLHTFIRKSVLEFNAPCSGSLPWCSCRVCLPRPLVTARACSLCSPRTPPLLSLPTPPTQLTRRPSTPPLPPPPRVTRWRRSSVTQHTRRCARSQSPPPRRSVSRWRSRAASPRTLRSASVWRRQPARPRSPRPASGPPRSPAARSRPTSRPTSVLSLRQGELYLNFNVCSIFMVGLFLVPAPQSTSRSVGVSPSRCAHPSPRSPALTSPRMFARPPSL